MVARAQRLMNGVVFPLAFGCLLLAAAVTFALDPWPGNDDGTQLQYKYCNVQAGPPGQGGCCTYATGVCWSVAAINDPVITNACQGNTNFKTEQSRPWGFCGDRLANSNQHPGCVYYPEFICAQIQFYGGSAGNCTPLTNPLKFWVVVKPNTCDPTL